MAGQQWFSNGSATKPFSALIESCGFSKTVKVAIKVQYYLHENRVTRNRVTSSTILPEIDLARSSQIMSIDTCCHCIALCRVCESSSLRGSHDAHLISSQLIVLLIAIAVARTISANDRLVVVGGHWCRRS